MTPNDYVTRVFADPGQIDATQWDALLALDEDPSPFMGHAYLSALHASGCAVPDTGWAPAFLTLWQGDAMVAACPLYLKAHSYGEYVFDWAWADAHERHGIRYYPKALVAVPFTPVPGTRLLARNDDARRALLAAVVDWCQEQGLSSLHLLFARERDLAVCQDTGLLVRHTVQFHWHNDASQPYADFDAFLTRLQQDKRKKIRQERRKVNEAGVSFRWARGRDITNTDWDFFYRCYERTYLEHRNAPYLNREFFQHMAQTMPDHWLLFVAERDGRPIASSLIALDPQRGVAYGRYWGALERVDCLHFEACYYQPIAWCIAHSFKRFEGGAQGEHKMARALLPVKTSSAHWLAHPAFADAVERYLEREAEGVSHYLDDLRQRLPLRRDWPGAPS